MLKKQLLLLAAAMLLTINANAQKSMAEKADNLFDQNRFVEALEQYTKVYEKIKGNNAEKSRVYFQMAECYRLMYDYPRAERIYKRLASEGYDAKERKLYFNLAEMCRFEEKFDEADKYYGLYLQKEPGDSYARKRKESLVYANQLSNNRTRHEVTKMEEWSSDYNDWAPRFLGDDTTKLIFTTSRFAEGEGLNADPWTNQAFSDLYQVFQDRNSRWADRPEPFDKTGKINTGVNEGEPCFSPDGSVIYFTRCDVREKEMLGCRIYSSSRNLPSKDAKTSKKKAPSKKDKAANKNKKGKSDKNGSADEPADGEWGEPTLIFLGDTSYNFLYPAVTSDGLTIYFTSDMPGGFGEYDLWKATRQSTTDDFGKAVNLGSIINTPGREVMPLLRTDSLLYFSSDGHPGIGGQDLFSTTLKKGGKFDFPQNLGVPINSSYDEMSIVFYPVSPNSRIMERGFFSSNRPFADPHNRLLANQNKSKTAPINDDLFYFELPALNYSIEGTVRDEKSMQLMQDVRVKLVGSDGTETEVRTDKRGHYKFDSTIVRRDVIYKLYLSKKDYYSIEGSESTRGYTTNKYIKHDFRMDPVPRTPVVLPEIRFDLARTELKGEFMDSLMDLLVIMENNPGLVVEIRSHTDCQPYVGLTNDTLSQRRAQTVVDYLVNRGIERERLVAKGYADRIPRVLDEDVTVTVNGERYTFLRGTVMSCDYINTLSGDRQQAAHSLNRRIEFLVLRDDYVSRREIDNIAASSTTDGKVVNLVNNELEDLDKQQKPSIIHDESTVDVTMVNATRGEITCIVNSAQQVPMLIDERFAEPVAISWEEAMNLLYQQRITKEDFPMRDESFDPEGNIVDRAMVVFKEMQIGEQRRQNVEVIVVKGIDYKFVINRTGLKQFGEYEFDKQRAKLVFFDE